MTVARSEVSGIPTFLAEAPGSVAAGLVFRVGVCDEALPVRGITHLCEHMALSTFDRRDYAFNGFVTPNLTHFVVQGSPDQVVRHLSDVAEALHDLPTSRFEKE